MESFIRVMVLFGEMRHSQKNMRNDFAIFTFLKEKFSSKFHETSGIYDKFFDKNIILKRCVKSNIEKKILV